MPKQVLFDKEKILDLLIPLFIDKGFNGSSMQDIVDITNLNRSSIYNTFGDKHQLFQLVLERYALRQLNLTEEILKMDVNVKTALIRFLRSLVLPTKESPNVNGCLLTNCSLEMGNSDAGIKAFLSKCKDVMIDSFEKVLLTGQQKGEIDSALNPKNYAVFLYNNLQGLRVMNSATIDLTNTERVIESFFEKI